MPIKFQLEWTDYLQAQFLNAQQALLVRIITYIVLSFVGLVFVGGLYLSIVDEFPLMLLVPAFIALALVVLNRYVFFPRRVKRLFFQQKELNMPFELEITDAGLKATNEYGQGSRPWATYIKWKQNKDLLLLYHSDIMFSILPKRFLSVQQLETIKTFLIANKVPISKDRFPIGCVIYLVLVILLAWMLYRAAGV